MSTQTRVLDHRSRAATAYEGLIERDYGWDVEQKVLVGVDRDPIVDSVSCSKNIRVVNVNS